MLPSDNELAAAKFRKVYFLTLILAGKVGSEGYIRQACDLAQEALVKLLNDASASKEAS
jgi:hypothetical protein